MSEYLILPESCMCHESNEAYMQTSLEQKLVHLPSSLSLFIARQCLGSKKRCKRFRHSIKESIAASCQSIGAISLSLNEGIMRVGGMAASSKFGTLTRFMKCQLPGLDGRMQVRA